MKTEAAITGTFPVGKYSCIMTLGPGGFVCEWKPSVPPPNSLTTTEIRQYKAGRDGIAARYAERFGGRVLVVDV